jgi:hypothetical protein
MREKREDMGGLHASLSNFQPSRCQNIDHQQRLSFRRKRKIRKKRER